MQRFDRHTSFSLADSDIAYEQRAKGKLFVRSESIAFVYWWPLTDGPDNEILVGYGTDPFEIDITPGFFRVACDARCWISPGRVEQTIYRTTDEVFTSLDRPAPLSPEMMAISRLMRQNEIERERMRIRIENAERNAVANTKQLRGSDSVVLEEPPAPSDDNAESDDSSGNQEDETPADELVSEEAEVPKPRRKAKSTRTPRKKP